MNQAARQMIQGSIACIVATVPFLLRSLLSPSELLIALGVSIVYAAGSRPERDKYADSIMGAASWCVPLWAISKLVVAPVVTGSQMEWSAPDLQSHSFSFIVWVSFASLFGLCFKALSYLAPLTSVARVQPDESDRTSISIPSLELVFGWFRLQ
jgi:hypothetical protein